MASRQSAVLDAYAVLGLEQVRHVHSRPHTDTDASYGALEMSGRVVGGGQVDLQTGKHRVLQWRLRLVVTIACAASLLSRRTPTRTQAMKTPLSSSRSLALLTVC